MTMKHIVPILSVGVNRDITTTIYPQVPEHEILVLQHVHGESNVYPGDVVDETALDADREYERLCSKYSESAVREAYGATAKGDIRRLVQANATGTREDERPAVVLEGPDSSAQAATKTAAEAPAEAPVKAAKGSKGA